MRKRLYPSLKQQIDDEIISDMTKINKEVENYYKNFLTSTISQEKMKDYEDHFALFTSNLQNPKLCQDEASELEHELTKDELLNALKGFQPVKPHVTTVLQKKKMKLSSNFYGKI